MFIDQSRHLIDYVGGQAYLRPHHRAIGPCRAPVKPLACCRRALRGPPGLHDRPATLRQCQAAAASITHRWERSATRSPHPDGQRGGQARRGFALLDARLLAASFFPEGGASRAWPQSPDYTRKATFRAHARLARTPGTRRNARVGRLLTISQTARAQRTERASLLRHCELRPRWPSDLPTAWPAGTVEVSGSVRDHSVGARTPMLLSTLKLSLASRGIEDASRAGTPRCDASNRPHYSTLPAEGPKLGT